MEESHDDGRHGLVVGSEYWRDRWLSGGDEDYRDGWLNAGDEDWRGEWLRFRLYRWMVVSWG